MIKWLAKFRWIPLNTYGPCVALTLWKWDRLKIELWYAPAAYKTVEHTHEQSDGEFMVLYSRGRMIWRQTKTCAMEAYNAVTPGVWGRWFSVRAGTVHAFGRGKSCMIWVCVERWKSGVPVTSVANDFHPV